MSDFAYGPDAGLPAGYARCAAGTMLWRGHTPGLVPGWFGPAAGDPGRGRFDAPVRGPADPGTCYLAAGLEGVLLERVLRDRPVTFVSRRTLAREHALARARVERDLVLVDLLVALAVHGLQVADVAAPPDLRGVLRGGPSYPRTQALAARWARAAHPVPVDGIVYGSRFGPAALCVALWDRAAAALSWGPSAPLDADIRALVAACNRLGLGLLP